MPISSNLVFISNQLLDKELVKTLNVPLEPIAFAFIDGKMYKHYGNEGTFVLDYGKDWGNNVVYGIIYSIIDFHFYIHLLDSYHQCSKSLVGFNHPMDVHHRIEVQATPIHFDTLDEFSRLKYRESEPLSVNAYHGNLNHPRIKQRLNKTVSYRITDGIDPNFIKLFGR